MKAKPTKLKSKLKSAHKALLSSEIPPTNVLILCRNCSHPLTFFCYMGQGHDRKTVWYCDHKSCKSHHIFIY